MPFVTVKKKYQVVIPVAVRRKLRIEVGDLLEARFERGKITFTPKSVIDRGIEESLEDFKKGRVYGPFDTAEEMIASLHRIAKRPGRAKRPLRTTRAVH